jgi:tripartite-type tricarboxylate transporter receptor subunit TctC
LKNESQETDVSFEGSFDASRRAANKALAALAAQLLAGSARAEEAYPERLIRFIVPQPAGGTGDVISRIVAQALAARLGKPVVIDNKAGAGGTLGASAAAKSPADGYTWVLASPGFATFAQMFPHLSFNPAAELAPVGMLGSVPVAMVVRNESPYKSVADFIAHAKANPGKASYASAGIGALSHLMGAWFRSAAGVDILHVPYGGTAPALTSLLGGQTDIYFDPMSGAELIKTRRLRALATTGGRRSSMLPEVPTMNELGIPIEGSVWLGVMAPAGTPAAVIEKINRELAAVLREPAVKQQMEARLVAPDPMSVQQFARFFANETRVWGKLVRDNGIKGE